MDRRANRGELKLDRRFTELVDAACAHGGAIAHEASRLVIPLGIDPVDVTPRSKFQAWPGSTGGGIDGMIAASDANLAATTDKTIIIPGHGKPVSNRAELKEFRDMLVAIGRALRRSRSKDDREARRSRQSRPLPLMPSGATSPASSPGWSMKARDHDGRPAVAPEQRALLVNKWQQHWQGMCHMGTITTKDGTEIYYKD
jgi:hypothetical protein